MSTPIPVDDDHRAKNAVRDLGLRPSVLWFARAMEAQLRKHDATKGGQANWRKDLPADLMVRVEEETAELWAALHDGPTSAVVNEAADVANFAMMVADVLAAEPDADDPESGDA